MNTIRLHPNDNIAIAKNTLHAQVILPQENGLAAQQMIPARHKIAVRAIAKGEAIRKFDQCIGYAICDIAAGEHVHQHNCHTDGPPPQAPASNTQHSTRQGTDTSPRTFMGYRRPNGKVGTRNFLLVISSVNCSATVSRRIADELQNSGELDRYPNVNGVFAFTHGAGCTGPAGDITDRNLSNVMWGYATHPNVAGVLMVGLGCEEMQIERFMEEHHAEESQLFQYLNIQHSGGSRQTVSAGVERLKTMLPLANEIQRSECPASALTIGLQCGGSDAWSGISANPALGSAVDLIIAQGGSAILAETPEMMGAEHLLFARAANEEIKERLQERLDWWAKYPCMFGGEGLTANVSPGNAVGGLSTLWEKSLGAQAKSGTTPLRGCYHYGEQITEQGFVFMDSPGADFVSVTGQIASGANLVCFTTGAGSAFGSKPAPTIKLATNSELFTRMEEDMDINCGDIVDGTCSVQQKGEEVFETFLLIASGEKSKSETFDYGDNECVPWQVGVVL